MPDSPVLFVTNIIGAPAGWARAGACIRGGHAAIYEKRTGRAATWRELVLLHLTEKRPTDPIACPVSVVMLFDFERPKSHSGKHGLKPSAPRKHVGKPDLDNLVKLVMDAMVTARVLEDDRSVVCLQALKRWGVTPGCSIVVREE